MPKILESASKIVFILMAIAVTVMSYMGIVDSKDFIVLCSMAFTFYFTKGTPPNAPEK